MKIRPYTREDVRDMVAVAKCLPSIWKGAFSLNSLPIDLCYQRGFVAVCENKIIGFVSCSSEDGIPHICKLGIAPAHHREGVGRRLVTAVEKDARKSRAGAVRVVVMGWTRPSNRAFSDTRKFYKALGFKVVKKHPMVIEGKSQWRFYTLEKRLSRTR